MRRDGTADFMKNDTELPARLVNVLFNVVALGGILTIISLWIRTRGSNNGFIPREFAEGPGMGELKLTSGESKEVEEYFNSQGSSPGTRDGF